MTPDRACRCRLPDEQAVARLAAELGKHLRPPVVIYLRGELGAGKTTFARALIGVLGYPGRVKSPTYGLLETYPVHLGKVVHLDLYRIGSPGELEFLALRDQLDESCILLVEWPERGQGQLPAADLLLAFGEDVQQRFVDLSPLSNRGRELIVSSTSKF